jgi:hypothetical protein
LRSVLRGLLTVVSLPIAFLCGLYASAFISLFGTEEPWLSRAGPC